MTQQILKTIYKEAIKKDQDLQMAIAKANNVVFRTVDRWLKEDNVILTTVTNLELIRNRCGLTKSETLTEPAGLQVTQVQI
jgi:hypothetical protein